MKHKRYPQIRFKGFNDDWEKRKLNEISDVRDGTHDSPKYINEGHPFITSKNVKNGYDRDKDSESSKNRKWKNPWFIYIERLNLTPEEMELRLGRLDYEESKIGLYDYVIKNDELEKTVQIIMTIIENELRLENM